MDYKYSCLLFSLEYGGKWKMLHYFARHFFSPTLISPYMEGGDVDVFIVLDELQIREQRLSNGYRLHFKPKTNPRPFNGFDQSTSRRTSGSGPPDFSGNLIIEMYSWNNMTALHSWTIPFEVGIIPFLLIHISVQAFVVDGGDKLQ